MKNTVKRFSIFSAAALMALTVFAGVNCFAARTVTSPDGVGYTASGSCEVQSSELSVSADIADGAVIDKAVDKAADASPEIQTVARSRSDSSSSEKSLGKSLGIGIGAGFIITIIVCICILISYKKHGTTEPYNYTENAKLTLIDSSDVLINTHIEKRKINNN